MKTLNKKSSYTTIKSIVAETKYKTMDTISILTQISNSEKYLNEYHAKYNSTFELYSSEDLEKCALLIKRIKSLKARLNNVRY